jgi:hypothetical protein
VPKVRGRSRWSRRARVLAAASGIASLAVLGLAAAARSGPIAFDSHPAEDLSRFACDGDRAIVTEAGYYVPRRDKGLVAGTPVAALRQYLTRVYPNAPGSSQFEVAGVRGEETKFVYRNNGRLQASVTVSSTEGEFHIGQFALCESLAKQWSR